MLSPLLLLRMKGADVSSTVAGLFAAAGWLGIFVMTPFASAVSHRLGPRVAMWVASAAVSELVRRAAGQSPNGDLCRRGRVDTEVQEVAPAPSPLGAISASAAS